MRCDLVVDDNRDLAENLAEILAAEGRGHGGPAAGRRWSRCAATASTRW
jgi:hypothetical protein